MTRDTDLAGGRFFWGLHRIVPDNSEQPAVSGQRRSPGVYAGGVSVATVTPSAPTVGAARRAATPLIAAGAEEVLVFGSVARGTAGPDSDIDLVAIFADIDYSDRSRIEESLRATAVEALADEEAAERWPVGVLATDWPEWRQRCRRVPASLEATIERDAISVATAARRRRSNWAKPMIKPMSNSAEAVEQFGEALLRRVHDLAERAGPGRVESDPEKSAAYRERERRIRVINATVEAALTCEISLKVLLIAAGKVGGVEVELKKLGRNVDHLMQRFEGEATGIKARRILQGHGVNFAEIGEWRARGTYNVPEDRLYGEAEALVGSYVAAAVELFDYTTSVILPLVTDSDQRAALAAEAAEATTESTRWDVISGVANPPPQPGIGMT